MTEKNRKRSRGDTEGEEECALLCGTSGEFINCKTCRQKFHKHCVKVVSPVPQVWHCHVCSLSRNLSGDSFADTYRALAKIDPQFSPPLLELLSGMGKKIQEMESRIDFMEFENDCLRKKLESAVSARTEMDTTEPQPVIKKKCMLLVGNDAKSLHSGLVEYLPDPGAIECHHFSSQPLQTILTDLRTIIETKPDKDCTILLHPWTVDCDLNRSGKIIPALKEFLAWMKTIPGTRLHVISIPQVVKDECEHVNNELRALATDSNRIHRSDSHTIRTI